jgi:hypothetical protein
MQFAECRLFWRRNNYEITVIFLENLCALCIIYDLLIPDTFPGRYTSEYWIGLDAISNVE